MKAKKKQESLTVRLTDKQVLSEAKAYCAKNGVKINFYVTEAVKQANKEKVK